MLLLPGPWPVRGPSEDPDLTSKLRPYPAIRSPRRGCIGAVMGGQVVLVATWNPRHRIWMRMYPSGTSAGGICSFRLATIPPLYPLRIREHNPNNLLNETTNISPQCCVHPPRPQPFCAP